MCKAWSQSGPNSQFVPRRDFQETWGFFLSIVLFHTEKFGKKILREGSEV